MWPAQEEARKGRSIDPILDSLKREARSRRQITRELAIWPPARSTRVSGGDRARASVEPGRLLDNGNNKVGQEKGERGGEFIEGTFCTHFTQIPKYSCPKV